MEDIGRQHWYLFGQGYDRNMNLYIYNNIHIDSSLHVWISVESREYQTHYLTHVPFNKPPTTSAVRHLDPGWWHHLICATSSARADEIYKRREVIVAYSRDATCLNRTNTKWKLLEHGTN